MYLFQKIEDLVMKYTDARQGIGQFLLQEREKVNEYTMQEIAKFTYTSKSTLVRFAQTLGYSGWKDFMKSFVEEVYYEETHYSDMNPNFPFDPSNSTKEIINNISNLQVESILDTADLLKIDKLEEAVDMLIDARNIVIFGISPNTFIAEIFRRKMLSIGKIISVATVDEEGNLARALTEKDCAIIVSYSGNNVVREPMRYIEHMKNRGVNLIGITSGGHNYIRQHISCILDISSRERLYTKISNFSTEQSILHIFNILYSVYFNRGYDQNLNYKIQSSIDFEYRREGSLNNMKEDREFQDNIKASDE